MYGAFDFYAIPLSLYEVMYDITTTPEGPCYKHFYSHWHIM